MNSILVPPEIQEALLAGASIELSISGGKDSDVMTMLVMEYLKEKGLNNPVRLWHSDLGRAEWRDTPEYILKQAHKYGLDLVVCTPTKNGQPSDLLNEIDKRRAAMDADGKQHLPHWPSSASRYCTKSMKETEHDKWIRQAYPKNEIVIVAMGLRDEESSARAKKPDCWERESAAPSYNRQVLNWLPIRKFSLSDIWEKIGYTVDELSYLQLVYKAYWRSGQKDLCAEMEQAFKAHPAYLRGNQRLSCAFCVLANENDWHNAAEHMPELYREYVKREIETGFSFTHKHWLKDLRPDLLTE